MMPSWEAGAEAYRDLEQGGNAPDVARLSDRTETEMSLALAGLTGMKARAMGSYLAVRRVASGSIAIVGWEGDEEAVAERRRATTAVLRRHGGAPLGSSPGRAWAKGRFHAPYLRDELLFKAVPVEKWAIMAVMPPGLALLAVEFVRRAFRPPPAAGLAGA